MTSDSQPDSQDMAPAHPPTADELLPVVYRELQRLAAIHLSHEQPGQTLQATALVHEVYMQLFASGSAVQWNSRGHFFSAAAEAMRRILVDQARRKRAQKRGGSYQRVEIAMELIPADEQPEKLLALEEALVQLESRDPQKAQLVKLRFFGGLTVPQAAKSLGISTSTAERYWNYARAWLQNEIGTSLGTEDSDASFRSS
jgi:RNA polymerase sigma factor (TIGR02999 family)